MAADPARSRVALVTGASGGIGRALAVGLAGAGLAVAVHGRDRDRLAAVAAEVAAAGGPVQAVTADVRDLDAVRRMVADVEEVLGPVDLLLNNAGVIDIDEVPVWEADPEDWRRVVEVDLLGPFHCIRAVVPGMVARDGGRVVGLASGASAVAYPVSSAYNVAKTGLARLSGHLALAGGAHGIRSFEVSPGVVQTPMTRSMAVHDGRTEWTPKRAVVEIVLAIARGELDAWSGRLVRAGVDDVTALRRLAAAGLPDRARVLGISPYGPDDPLPRPAVAPGAGRGMPGQAR